MRQNIEATQLAGAAVAHFLNEEKEPILECIRSIPDPPGAVVALLRFAALAVSQAAVAQGELPIDCARELTVRVAELNNE